MGIDHERFAQEFAEHIGNGYHVTAGRLISVYVCAIADEAAKASAPATAQHTGATKVTYERFTDRARRVMQFANQEALRFNHESVGTEHVALGLVKEHSGVASFVLNKAGIDMGKVRLEVEKLVQSGPNMVTIGKLPNTARTNQVLAYAIEESRALGHLYVGIEHILLGLLREPEGIGGQVIRGLGLSPEDARRAIKEVHGEQLNKDSAPAASEPKPDEPPQRAESVSPGPEGISESNMDIWDGTSFTAIREDGVCSELRVIREKIEITTCVDPEKKFLKGKGEIRTQEGELLTYERRGIYREVDGLRWYAPDGP